LFIGEEKAMTPEELKNRTKEFALRIMGLVDAMPKTTAGRTVGDQLVRSATSVGANYRAACRGRSKAEFIAKLGIVIEEADESAYWLELINASKMLPEQRVNALLKEANELAAIFTASVKSASANQKSTIRNKQC
jgi:four helix bundle protein